MWHDVLEKGREAERCLKGRTIDSQTVCRQGPQQDRETEQQHVGDHLMSLSGSGHARLVDVMS